MQNSAQNYTELCVGLAKCKNSQKTKNLGEEEERREKKKKDSRRRRRERRRRRQKKKKKNTEEVKEY